MQEFPPDDGEMDLGVDEAGARAPWEVWPATGQEEAAMMLPCWDVASEQPEHQVTVVGLHTKPCADFHAGYCSNHRPKGKASPCFCYHFESQHRRPPVEMAAPHRLAYWDVPCSSMARDSACPYGDACVFAHSREEISYHPSKYKTRRCNGRGCRGEAICCFAHSEAEMRVWAPERYSYWSLVSGRLQSPRGPGDWQAPPASGAARNRRPLAVGSQPPLTRHKQRFCASYPDVSQCRRGSACAFAHSREEARTPLLSVEQEQTVPSALTEEFFMYKFKTLWCPIGVQHDWQTCVYAHNYQDARRQVSIGYGPRPCPYWAKKDPGADYTQRCPLALRCPFSHGAKEQLYHPQYFRTVICRDLRVKACPRQKLCAFFHRRAERRKPPTDTVDYSVPLDDKALPPEWVSDFLTPPFQDVSPAGGAPGHGGPVDEFAELAEMVGCLQGGGYLDDYCTASTAASSQSPPGLMPGMPPLWGKLDAGADLSQRFSLLPPPKFLDGENGGGTPRTQTGESEIADDSSTSTSRDAATGERGYRAHHAVGTRSSVAASAAAGPAALFVGRPADPHAPWKVKAPTYGPFGGPFNAFPGFLPSSLEPKGPLR